MRDFVVKILVQLKLYKPVINWINRLKFEKQSRLMHKYGLEMLNCANEAMAQCNMHPVPFFGTLLGAFRDHGFIPYDPDIDLAVPDEEVCAEFHKTMTNHGFKLYKQNYLKEGDIVLEETYLYKKLHLDIYRLFRRGSDFYCLSSRIHESKDWKEANQSDGFPCVRYNVEYCSFHQEKFLGITINMPDKTHEWLKDLFSDSYMIPIKNFDVDKVVTRKEFTPIRSYRRFF